MNHRSQPVTSPDRAGYLYRFAFLITLIALLPQWVAAADSLRSPAQWLNHYGQAADASSPQGCNSTRIPNLSPGKPSEAFELAAPASHGEALVVFSEDTISERVIVLATDRNGCVHAGEAGRALPFESRSIDSVLPNVRLPGDLNDSPIVVIIEDRKSVRPWLSITTESEFRATNTKLWTTLGAYSGVVLVLLLVGTGIAWWHRSALAVAYVIYAATLQNWQLQQFGLGWASLPFWPDQNGFLVMQVSSVAAVIAGIATVVVAFIQPKGWARVVLIGAVALTCLVYMTAIWTPTSYRLASALLLLITFFTLFLLYDRLRGREASVRWFAAGFAATMIGGSIQAGAVITGGAGFNSLAVAAFPIGTLFEAAFWMIAVTSALRGER
ncbi:MAG: 7TM diverse intracellular signaling domain-containing protein, partial [Gammaproteobacteria bacterium]